MFYGVMRTCRVSQLEKKAIIDYNDYYNNKRIKVKLTLVLCNTESNFIKLFV